MTKKAKNPKPEHIGKLIMYIIGRQYYDANIEQGDSVYFQRDPENDLSPNTVLVAAVV